jgi:imidazolonepropionase-like amidohydrolase
MLDSAVSAPLTHNHPAAGGEMLWLTGGQVFDVESGRFRHASIAIEGERIAGVADGAAPGPEDRSLDVRNCYLLPGLIDCHVHLAMPTDEADPSAVASWPDALIAIYAMKAAERTLLGGTTTVRDCGGWNYVEMAVRKAIKRGWCVGPRMVLAGRLLSITTGGVDYYPGMYEVANGPDEVRAAARRQLARGADFIKVMATGAMLSPENEDARAIQFTLEELKAAAEIAKDNFKHMAAHAHACQGILNAVEAGADSIEHGTYADERALRLMAERKVTLVPTFCATTSMLHDPKISKSMPPHLHERLVASGEVRQQMVKQAHRLGVPIAMGTDAGTPGNHHGDNVDECIAMVDEAGLSPAESLRAATINGARLLRQENNLGSLAPGKFADIVAVRENPLNDIRALKRPVLVMKGGTAYLNALS